MVDPDIEQQMAKFAPSSNPQIGAGSDIDPDAAAIVKSVLPQGGTEVRQVGPPNIDPDAFAIVEAKRNAVRATMSGVAGQNPDQAAEAQRIGREFGVSGEFVLRNMEDMKRMQAIRSVERRELMQQDPILARFLTNQDFAAIAHDDLDNLSTTERIYNNAVDFVNPKSWDTIKGRFQRGMDLVEMGRANDVMGLRAQWSPTPRASKDIAEEIKILPTDGGLIGSAAEVLGQMVAGIPEVAETTLAGATMGGAAGLVGGPLAPATVPAGIMLGVTAGLPVGLARVAGMSEAGNALQEMRTHAYGEIERLVGEGYSREQATNMVGYDDATAQNFAMGVGIINGIIETASFEVMGPVARRLVGNVIREKVSEAVMRPTMRRAVTQFAKDYRNAVLTESGEEFLQQWVGIVGDEMQRKYGSNLPSRFNDEGSVKAAIAESFEAALEGAKGAMLIGGVGPTGNLYFDMKRARQSVRQQAFFNRLTDAAKNSKVRQRDTPTYEKFIEGQVEGKDIDTVYIDAQQLNGVLRQAEINGVATAAELDQLLPGVRQQLAEALETNGDVTVPMSVWQGRVSGTKVGDALLPHVRLAPDAWSVTDRLEWEKKRAALMQEAEEILDEQEKTDTTARSSAAKVEDKIKQQLVESGAMDEKSAAANAKFYRSMIILLAKRAGMTPEQFQEQHGLQVIGPATRQAAQMGKPLEQAVRPEIIAQLTDAEVEKLTDYAYEVGAIQADLDALETELDKRFREEDDPSGGEETINPFGGKVQPQITTGYGAEELMRQMAALARQEGYTAQQLGKDIRTSGDFAMQTQMSPLPEVTDEELGREAFAALEAHEARLATMRERLRRNGELLRQSSPVASIDADYLAAVRRGDLETAQRMVDEQTKLAQPKVEQELRSYAKDLATLAQQIYDEWDQDADGHSEELGTGGICDLISSAIGSYLSERGFDIQDGGQEGDDHAWIYASKHGATFAVDIAPDTYEIGRGYSWRKRPNVVFDGNHIDIGSVTFADVYGEPYKPDPVTRDEQGKIVPLSRRFDITSSRLFEQAGLLPNRTLGDLVEAKIGMKDADFYIVRRGTPDAVGKPTREYNPEHIGIKVVRTDVLMPQYLFYVMQYLHGQGQFKRIATGTTSLVGIRVNDITRIPLGNTAIFRQAVVPASFYSALQKELSAVASQAMPAQGWIGQINNLINKGAIKKEEVEWSGLMEWIEAQPGRITKDSIVRFVNNNGIRVKVIEKTTDGKRASFDVLYARAMDKAEKDLQDAGVLTPQLEDAIAQWRELLSKHPVQAFDPHFAGTNYARFVMQREKVEAKIDAALARLDNPNARAKVEEYFEREEIEETATNTGTKWEQWSRRGGSNYREVLLTIPVNVETTQAAAQKARIAYRNAPKSEKQIVDAWDLKRVQRINPDATKLRQKFSEREFLDPSEYQGLDIPWIQEWLRSVEENEAAEAGAFIGNHWAEWNVVTHIRFKDRVDESGRRILEVLEIQSDWADAVRDNGVMVADTQELRKQQLAALNQIQKMSRDVANQADMVRSAMSGKAEYLEPTDAYSEITNQTYGHREASEWLAENADQVREAATNSTKFDEREKQLVVRLIELTQEFVRQYKQYEEAWNPQGAPSGPFVSSTSAYINLALKQVLLEAVNGRYDGISFLSGDQVADMLHHGVIMDEISVNDGVAAKSLNLFYEAGAVQLAKAKDPSAYRLVTISQKADEFDAFDAEDESHLLVDPNGIVVDVSNSALESLNNKPLEKAVGKDIAAQIMTADLEPGPLYLDGGGQRTGVFGMRAFYEQMIPLAFNKMLSKYGGNQMQPLQIETQQTKLRPKKELRNIAKAYIDGDIDARELIEDSGLGISITVNEVEEFFDMENPDPYMRGKAKEWPAYVEAMMASRKYSKQNGTILTDELRQAVMPGLPLFQLPKFNLYSALAQQVSAMSDKPMSADTWKQQIQAWVNKGLVKQDELEWTGFTDYLAMQQGKISKAMVMSFLNGNGVQVERVRLGEQNTEADDTQRQRAREFFDLFKTNYGTVTINGIELFDDDVGFRLLDGSLTADDLPADLQEPAKRWLAAVQVANEERKLKYAGPARYSDDKLVLPNGSNYRELLLTLPLATPEITVSENLSLEGETEFYELSFVEPVLQAQSRLRGFVAQNDDGSWRASFQGDMTERDSKDSAILWVKNQMSRVAPQVTKQTGFRASHWEGIPNVVVHLRLNDRMDADGKKVLFVEEVQSDYGQKGRKKGFADNKKLLATQRRLSELQIAKSSLWPQAKELLGLVDNLGFETAAEALAAIHEIRVDEKTGVAMATSDDGGQWELAPLTAEQLKPLREYVDLEVEARKERKNLKSYSEALPAAPFVQTTDGWLNLGLKQVVLEAIRGQYDRVAFITGEQSARRYSLDKTVKMIVVTPRTNAVTQEKTRSVALELTNGTVLELGVNADGVVDNVNAANREMGRRFLGEPLEEVVGKDMADKIMQTERGTFEGNDLKVGGEGMKAFYDSIVPTAVNKLLKKYGGGKLESVELGQKWDASAATPQEWNSEQVLEILDRGGQVYFIKNNQEELVRNTQELDEYIRENGEPASWVYGDKLPKMEQPGFSVTPEMVKRVADAGGLPLFQAAPRENARGGFDPRRMTILLGQKADLSTFLHESAHWYLTVLSELAAKPGATAEVVQDMNTLLAWFGVPDITAWNRMTIEEQRKYHEQFAYNFEIYISQGRAPSIELEGMFERFAAWLKNVYENTIKTELNKIYRREYGEDLPILTGEVRQVMDRMLATDRQIREAEAIREMKPMFLTQEESGMDDATWKAYQDMVEEATQAAITDMTKASVRQMQWLSGARAKILRDLQARHRKLRKAMREEVTEQVRRTPLYRAMAFVRTGKSINPDGTAIKALGAHRLDMEAVRQMYVGNTTPMPDINALGTGGRGMMGANGLDPDTVAELFGYSSGDELVRALAAAKPMREEVNRIVDDRMLKEHGELSDPEQMEVAVQKALHNEARARFVAVELRFVTKATEPARIMVGAAKQAAKDILGRKRLRDIKAGQFEAAESKAARDAQTAYGRRQTPEQIGKAAFSRAYNEAKDNGADDATATATATAKAAQAIARATERQKEYQERYGNRNPQEVIVRAKRAQLINNQLAGQAAAATEEVAKKVRYLRRVLNAENVKKIGAEYTDQIAQLLEKFDLAQRSLKSIDTRTRFAEWLEAKRAAGIEPEIPLSLQGAEKTNYKNLTLNDFRDLVMAVQQLEFMGKNHRKVLLAAQQKQFEELRDEIVQSVKDNSRGRKSKARSGRNDQERRRQGLKGFAASHLNVATIVRILDGGKDNGPLWRYLIRTANERADMETTMRAQATETLAAIFKPILEKDKMGGKGMFFDSVNDSFNLEARMVIALNMGNAGNMQRLLDGEGWTMEQIRPILESLTAEQWEAVQKVWDFLESYRPLIAEKERRIYGKEPEWVEPQPITVRTKDGATLTLRGGYYPVKYDPRASRRSESLDLAEQAKRDMAAAFSSATTRRTFTKNRAEKVVNRPLLYTLDAMYNGVSDVIHDLSWHEWLMDANRLYQSDLFYDAVNTTYGYEFVSQIGAWIKDVAAGEKSAQHQLEVALAFGRRNVGLMQMGMNVLSAAVQITGYAQSVVRVGAKWMGRGMSKSLANPKAANELVNSKSKFMANRGRTQFREIAEIKNMIRDQSGAMRSIHANAYILMLFMQRTVDVPTWIGAYEKARAEAHDEATAVALADQAVIDSQGSGMLKDLARVQRGGEFVKTFTMFYGFFNTTFNLAVAQTMTAKSKGKMLSDWIMLFVVPAMMSEALRRMLVPRRDDGDDDDPTMLARELAAAQLSYLMGTMVGVREFSDVVPKRLFGVPARGYSGPASLRGVTIVSDVVGEVVDFEADRQFRKALINAIGVRTGIPAVQINRTIDGLDAAITGETKNPTAVLFGTRK